MAVAVAETVAGSTDAFAAEMNATAAKLGLVGTHYNNVNGLPDDGQVTTARDLAVLAIDLRRTFPQYDDIYRTQAVTVGKATLKASNTLLAKFEGTTGMKTGFICASGLNVVATVQRGGRELMAVILGGSSARERDQLAAQLVLKGFTGEYQDGGKNVVQIVDQRGRAPMDMKPLLCGKQAKAYVASRVQAFPYGLKGKPTLLTDKVAGATYAAADFGVPGAAPVTTNPTDETAEGDTNADDSADAPPIPMTRRK
jgi:D-alanyl-D-alanine carboxypeptidase